LIIAEHVRSELRLDRVLFVPSAISPHKQNREATSPTHRLAMTRLAVQENEVFEVSEIEIRRGGISYTVDTLSELKGAFPSENLFLMIGMDNLLEFGTWKQPERIHDLASIVAMTRPGYETRKEAAMTAGDVTFCEVPEIGITSSDIRERVRTGRSIRYRVPAGVEKYIVDNGLYREDTSRGKET
jgi:nicotinate-nucleotide adenylyltransferase